MDCLCICIWFSTSLFLYLFLSISIYIPIHLIYLSTHLLLLYSKTLDQRMKRLATGEGGPSSTHHNPDADPNPNHNLEESTPGTPELLSIPSQQSFEEWKAVMIQLLTRPHQGIHYHGSVSCSMVVLFVMFVLVWGSVCMWGSVCECVGLCKCIL